MLMDYDVIVLGGGPAGLSVARHIALGGFKVLVIEEHPSIGRPLQCSGLVSPSVLELAGVNNDIVINELKGAMVYSPSGVVMPLSGNRVYALAIDRPSLDRQLYLQVVNAGAEVLVSTRATGLERTGSDIVVKTTSGDQHRLFRTPLIIGAEGVNSLVAQFIGMPSPEVKVKLFAAEVELPSKESELVKIFLGKPVSPGWFGWIIPLDKQSARVGVGVFDNKTSPFLCFQQLAAKYPEFFKNMKIKQQTGGIVPLGFPKKTYGQNAMVVGDAACQVKPISGGGLYFGLLCARHCATVAISSLKQKNFSEEKLALYQNLWEKEIGSEIKIGLRYRKVFSNFSDSQTDFVLRGLNRPILRSLILKYGDIDHPSKLSEKLGEFWLWLANFNN
jgi:geranylgeranyl reductase family protein